MSQMLIPTLRDIPAEAVIPSHQLLLKAGYIQKTAAGMYNYLPLGFRVLQKVSNIVREEMNNYGGQEVLMPITQPAELWIESGRWGAYGDELIRFTDRHNREFCLGPTHEEVITDLVRQSVSSYKNLPLRLYQIQNKYRDERRPRFGLMRGREFVMKDLYSFDLTDEGVDAAYHDMYEAYTKIFTRCGLIFKPVEADSGQIGGGYTHEFMVLAENGEGVVAYCPSCDYAANLEIAPCKAVSYAWKQDDKALEKIETPNCKTIDAVAEFLNLPKEETIKTLIFKADDELVAVIVRGDHSVNEVKFQRLVDCDVLEPAEEADVIAKIGAGFGSLGVVGLKNIKIYADESLKGAKNIVCGANHDGFHFIHVDLERDANIEAYVDLRMMVEGESCPHCDAQIAFARGIEVGQVFKLGTKYSEALGATVLDKDGKACVLKMGCYGIGVSRTVAAAVEQCHDEKGIIWPKEIAPFHVHVVIVNTKDEAQINAGETLYKELNTAGYDVLLDDRKERAGVKFNDADLIGVPLRITVGKKVADERIVEVKPRASDEVQEITLDRVLEEVRAFYN